MTHYSDTDILDFFEESARSSARFFAQEENYAWSETYFGPPSFCSRDNCFRFASLRESAIAAMIRDNYQPKTQQELP